MAQPARRDDEGAAVAVRVAALDWAKLGEELNAYGCAIAGALLSARECAAVARLYGEDAPFRSRVIMARHGFGRGEYKYFAYPLPDVVAALRSALYPPLAEIANSWNAALGIAGRFPAEHDSYLARCHQAGQTRPTPLLLQYGAGDYNCLHQDLYGEHVFPLQAAVLLSRPGVDFSGGEFVLTEQRPRMQSRGHAVTPDRGHAVIFTTRSRPVTGARGTYRAAMRHGTSTITRGHRFTLGIIFHDAE